jgi:hypothetical protein
MLAKAPLASSDRALNEPVVVLTTVLLASSLSAPAVLLMLIFEAVAALAPLPELSSPSAGVVPPEVLPATVMLPSEKMLMEDPEPVELSTVP